MMSNLFNFLKLVLLFLPKEFEKYLALLISKIVGKEIGIIQWALVLRIKKNHILESEDFKLLVPPRDKFWADPHVIKHKDHFFIFIEDYSYLKKKGHISVIVISPEGIISKPTKIIDKPYHMSYPFVFQSGDKYYMVPETSKSRRIELYVCLDFPSSWDYCKTLVEDVEALDSTLLKKDGKWWLFTSIESSHYKSPESNLHIFSSDKIESSNWEAHKDNPFLSDDHSSRSGGRIFRNRGQLFRPTQNCNGGYGKGIHLNLINELNQQSYSEKRFTSSPPLKKSYGLHTINFCDELEIFDVAKNRHDFFK